MGRYSTTWQAAAALADADAALGLGRLDLADSALNRVPKNLDAKQARVAGVPALLFAVSGPISRSG